MTSKSLEESESQDRVAGARPSFDVIANLAYVKRDGLAGGGIVWRRV
jgi:hypothetical protein